ncbi:uncharacterized protein PGTG_09774 [Puccinia graminis f. sp. tritici CRL 75-36-700-3]|uniref:Uncharacterized protein n=1 Tax=Puccinia graminis f. sp. tritici (strain CRL 75-36-700-3 / race SCCL) TaxID=418459 RepID=E3KID6_PUCGT|nr:uncharacterized protein PGTG_09774 [Puccinia graminis f. sp. tritici CRL 75-36-700-3]EFP84061.2 hypothetical protein PGTG_09774 [Puccinia graminis f. sp. tritici CRL 75-36-700-3]
MASTQDREDLALRIPNFSLTVHYGNKVCSVVGTAIGPPSSSSSKVGFINKNYPQTHNEGDNRHIVSAELVLDLDLAVALVKPCLDIRLFGGKVPKCWGGFIHSSSTRNSTVKLLSHRVNLPPAGKFAHRPFFVLQCPETAVLVDLRCVRLAMNSVDELSYPDYCCQSPRFRRW